MEIGVFIPIVAIVMGIGIGMLAIWSEHKRKAQLLEQNHRERMQAIEKGLELPPLPANLVGLPTSNGPSTSSPTHIWPPKGPKPIGTTAGPSCWVPVIAMGVGPGFPVPSIFHTLPLLLHVTIML